MQLEMSFGEYEQSRMWWLIWILFLALATYWWTRRRLYELAARLPGPSGAVPLLGNLLTFAGCDLVQFFQRLLGILQAHGPIARVWMGTDLFVLVADPVALERILGNKIFIKRTGYVTKLGRPFFRNGLLMSDGEVWRVHRKIIASTFHTNVLDQFVDNFAKNSGILSQKLSKVSDGRTFNVYPLISLFTLDVICETAMGTKVNAQLDDDGVYVRNVLRSVELIGERFMRPWLALDWVYNLTDLGREQAKVLEYLHRHARQVVIEKMEQYRKEGRVKTELEDAEALRRRKRQLSLLDLLIEDEQLSPEEIHNEVVTIVAAGSETTATSSSYVLALLGEYQDIQEKVFEEQKAVFGDDFLRDVTSEDLPHMPYLEQVIKEAMRLYPPIPYLFRMIETETDLGNGYILPAGCYSMIISYATHRNPKYFPDPERFDPERFSPENSVGRHPYAYIPFGAGRRMCVAYKFGLMEEKTLLSTLLRRYRVVKTVGGMKDIEKNLESGVVLKPSTGFNIQITPRISAVG